MTTVFSILGFILVVAILIIGFSCLVFAIHYFVWFHWRTCKHCNHTMEFKGLKDDENNGHYLFHCPKCGAWQQIPKEQFFREIDDSQAVNPYKDSL